MQSEISPPKILVSDPLSEEAILVLSASHVNYQYMPDVSADELSRILGGYDALIVRSRTKVTKDLLAKAPRLKVIGRAGVGVDNIDTQAAAQRNISIINTPSALTNAVAEFTIALMLELSRKIRLADASMKMGKWEKSMFHGLELRGRTYGTIGIGRIGQRVAEIAHAFGMKIMANDVIPIPHELIKNLGVRASTVDEILAEADFVDLHVPLTPETKNMIDYDKLSKMKKSAFLINTSRGQVVNESDLLRALNEGKIAGAALDVFETEPPTRKELLAKENLIATPHIAGQSQEAQMQAGTEIVNLVLKALQSAQK